LKIALAQINYHIGNFSSNVKKIRESIMKAKQGGADLVIFAELAISGYPPRDFLEFDDFVQKCQLALNEIAADCDGIAAIVGAPTFNPEFQGKDLYNAAYFLNNGKVEKQVNKTLLPNYDIFDEYRYFEPNKDFSIIEYKNKRIALTICEDLWNIGNNPMYTIDPMDELMKQKPDFVVNIAASPFHYDQAGQRKATLLQNVEKFKLPLFYVNHVGAQTELLFDGGSLAMSPKGFVTEELDYFNEDFRLIDLNKVEDAVKPEGTDKPEERISLIRKALVMGIRNYFQKLGFDRAVLGLSGGIDSAVTLVIATEALGAKNVYAVLLPSEFSSSHSVDDARQLAENLGCPYDIISIKNIYDSFMKSLKPQFKDMPFGIAEENIQARARGVLLMALSNKFGHILLNTSNKSEAAVGYGTLYGDMNGGLSVLGDVYKTQVFELARLINHDKEIIPENTINKMATSIP